MQPTVQAVGGRGFDLGGVAVASDPFAKFDTEDPLAKFEKKGEDLTARKTRDFLDKVGSKLLSREGRSLEEQA